MAKKCEYVDSRIDIDSCAGKYVLCNDGKCYLVLELKRICPTTKEKVSFIRMIPFSPSKYEEFNPMLHVVKCVYDPKSGDCIKRRREKDD